MSQVCRYYQRGHCKFGSNCNFLHPGATTSASNAFGGARTGFGGGGTQTKLTDGFTLPSAETIRIDLTERPTWRLSSYAPSKDSPAQLIDGKDISPEEARVMAYKLRAEGVPQAYEAEWNRLTSEASSQIRNILDNIPGAIEFLKNAQGAPSRYSSAQASGQQQVSPFGDQQGMGAGSGSSQAPSPSPFGQVQQPQSASGFTSFAAPTPFGARPTPAFGQSPFGQQVAQQTAQQPPAPAAPTFGQPAFGTPSQPQSAFGRPAFGQPAFGQSSSLGSQPSPFAAAAPNATPTPSSAFGQSSTQPTSAFGQSAFGVSSKPAFGQQTFGQSAFSQAQSSPFAAAAPSPFAQVAGSSTAAPFAQVTPKPPFGQPSQPQTASSANPFRSPPQQGAANPFQQAQAAQTSPSPFSSANPFQQGQQQQATSTAFPQATQGPAQAPTPSPFSQPTQPVNTFGSPAPQPSSFSTQNPFQSSQQGKASSALQAHEVNPQLREQQKAKKWDDPVIGYTPEEQATFSAGSFVLGQVPTVAPSRNMCWG